MARENTQKTMVWLNLGRLVDQRKFTQRQIADALSERTGSKVGESAISMFLTEGKPGPFGPRRCLEAERWLREIEEWDDTIAQRQDYAPSAFWKIPSDPDVFKELALHAESLCTTARAVAVPPGDKANIILNHLDLIVGKFGARLIEVRDKNS